MTQQYFGEIGLNKMSDNATYFKTAKRRRTSYEIARQNQRREFAVADFLLQRIRRWKK